MADRKRKAGAATAPESEEGLEYQRSSWRVQRVGWVLMGLFLVLGLLGLFGDGPLTRAHAGNPGALEARYHRVWRLQTNSPIELTAMPDSAGQVAVRIEESLLSRAEIHFVSPTPRRIEAMRGGQLFVFDAGGGGPVSLRVGIRPTRIGLLRTRLTTLHSDPILLSVLVLP